MKYDIIIVGAGPAGLTAALYAARYNLKVLVIGKIFGGTMTEASKVCNFPSHENISGVDLMKKMVSQVEALGVKVLGEEVLELKKDKDFEIKTSGKKYIGKKLILATGLERRKLLIAKENNFLGKGISYCATCDGRFYQDKVVGVVGGRNSALSSAILLSNFAKKVYIIYRQSKFADAEPKLVEDVKKNKKIEFVFESKVSKLIGDEKLKGVEINEKDKIKLNGLFIEIGGSPNLKLAGMLGLDLDKTSIVVDKSQKTNIEGVFAAGDLTNNPMKQIITACGEGAIAAQSAYREL